jgi:glycosyltransferase involved in cell wall biosynthesis
MTEIDPSILILSGARGDTRRYRAFHLYEQARLAGLNCQLSHVTDPEIRNKAERSSIVFLHRASFDTQIAWLEKEIHRRGGLLIQDLDDLIVDPDAIKYIDSPDFTDPIRLSLYQEDIRLYVKTLEMCDFIVTSGEFLADSIRQLRKSTWVHRNAFSLEMLANSERAYLSRTINPARIVIGYASGTPTHNQDFALVKPALKAILSRHANVELWLVGLLDPGDEWGSQDNQIHRLKRVPWRNLPKIQAQFDINLAPLRIDNPFGQSKSEIKYIEAGLLRIPTVASPSDAFMHAIRHADNGFLAGDPQEWESLLENLIIQPESRTSVGERAYQDVKLHYHPLVRARELTGTLNSMLGDKFALPNIDLSLDIPQDRLTQSFWSSADLERTPTLIQRGLYTLRYRSFRTLVQQVWIYIRRMISPIFPYRNLL